MPHRPAPNSRSAPIPLEPEPPAPALPGQVYCRATVDELLDDVCAELYAQACLCVRTFGDFHLALSADPVHLQVCMRLMIDPRVRELPWKKTHVWLTSAAAAGGREALRVAELLAGHSGIPEGQLHGMELGSANGSPQSLAAAYERRMQEALAWRERGQDRLDFVLLRVAPGGVAAGIDMDGWSGLVSPTTDSPGDAPAGGGVRMTANMVRGARLVAVLGTGGRDRDAVRAAVGEGGDGPASLRLRPLSGQFLWFLDDAANPEMPDRSRGPGPGDA